MAVRALARQCLYHCRMSFFAILFALLIEQVRPLARHNPIHAALRAWARWASRNFDAGKPHHGWVAWAVAVIAPVGCGALACTGCWRSRSGWPFAVLWSVAVLYVTLGFRQFSHHFTDIRDALDAGDEAAARELLAQWQQVDASELPRSEIVRHVIEYSVLAAHRHVFGVLAWFSVLAAFGLGPAGAVLYRMSEFVARYWKHRSHDASRSRPARRCSPPRPAPGPSSTGCRRASPRWHSRWSAASRRRSTAGATMRSAFPTTTTA